MLSKLNAGKHIEGTWLECLSKKSIDLDVCMIKEADDQTTPNWDFILHEKFPDNITQARKIRTTSARYVLVDNQLYK